MIASVPGSHPAFRRLQYEKRSESLGPRLGIVLHVAVFIIRTNHQLTIELLPVPLQVAEESGLEVLDKLADNPVSTREPQMPAGTQSLSSQEEAQLSSRWAGHPVAFPRMPVDRNQPCSRAPTQLPPSYRARPSSTQSLRRA